MSAKIFQIHKDVGPNYSLVYLLLAYCIKVSEEPRSSGCSKKVFMELLNYSVHSDFIAICQANMKTKHTRADSQLM